MLNPENSNTRPHHPFSPSTLQYREACPYYEPTNNETEAAKAGTRQHDAVDAERDNPDLDDTQAAAVAECLTYFDSIASKYPGGSVVKEEYLHVDDEFIEFQDWDENPHRERGTTAGYLDAAVISADQRTAEIVDWKFGKWAVEDTENNLQGMAYLLGLHKKYPRLQQITVHFFLPHRQEVNVHTFLAENFAALYRRVRTVVHRAIEARRNKDFTAARPNMSACLFCANAGRCDALTSAVLRIGKKFAPLQIPADISPTTLRDPQQAGLGLKVAGIVEAWARAYKTQCTNKALVDDNFTPEGYSLVSSQDREIKDPIKLREVARQYAMSDADIDKCATFFISRFDEVIKSRAPRGSKESTVKQFSQDLLEVGAVEMGDIKAFLRQERKQTTTLKQ